MRKIVKRSSPPEFEQFKTNYQTKNGREAKFDELPGSEKRILKMSLIDEQYGLCCYCMKKIDWYNSHVEHFVPQSADPTKDMAYDNLLASCEGYKNGRENCGHKKDSWYSAYLTVSPLDDLCEQIFEFTADGRIKSQDRRGIETIKHLDLDNDLLRRARKSAIFTCGIFDDDFDMESIADLITYYDTPENGELQPFCKAITYYLKNCI